MDPLLRKLGIEFPLIQAPMAGVSGTPQPARQVAALLATLAGAVQVAHQGGIVHRDLKLANLPVETSKPGR